jgi:beta-mannosidase
MERRHKKEPLPSTRGKTKGRAHLRKTPCHFGWDGGPFLAPAGIIGTIALESLETRIEDMRIRQRHRNDDNGNKLVELEIRAQLSTIAEDFEGEVTLLSPDGSVAKYKTDITGNQVYCFIKIENPQIWWCNGLGESPLYKTELTIRRYGVVVDTQEKQIGLRTIELDTSEDQYGAKFRFVVNGVPIFAKGANWIPADSFITRVKREDINFYVDCARRANMNMLRVWGGGMYGCEDFYDACDRTGILVWQDFIFACSAYPLYDESFLDNVHGEVADNVRRIRHRASLALWCGNNENEFLVKLWIRDSKIGKSNLSFYHDVLRAWVNELAGITSYWPGSPSAGGYKYEPQSRKTGNIRGDSHLWKIWYGMMPVNSIRKLPTRFCSEYGMESMPSMHTIRSFTNELFPSLFDPVMQLHQKAAGGNERMLYYLLANYRNPAKFEDLVYLSQLVQANMVHYATDFWRRDMELHNGSLFWQFNDCWPVASWAGIDYHKQLKAVTYQSRHFNKPLSLSNDYYKNRAELYIINELPQDFSGMLEWELCDFFGNKINNGMFKVSAPAVSSTKCAVLIYKDILNRRAKEEAVLIVKFVTEDDQVLDEKSWLLVPDRHAKLPQALIQFEDVKIESNEKGSIATLTLSCKVYARYVFLEAKGIHFPWSDNFFDIPAGRSKTITVQLPPQDIDTAILLHRVKARSLSNVKPKNIKLKDEWLRFLMVLKKWNWLSWLAYKFN